MNTNPIWVSKKEKSPIWVSKKEKSPHYIYIISKLGMHASLSNPNVPHKTLQLLLAATYTTSLTVHILLSSFSLITVTFHFPIITVLMLLKSIWHSLENSISRLHIDQIISMKRELNVSDDSNDDDYQTSNGRRALRSKYLAVKNMIHGGNLILFNTHSVFWFCYCILRVWYLTSLIAYGSFILEKVEMRKRLQNLCYCCHL